MSNEQLPIANRSSRLLLIPLLEQEGWLRASTIPELRADGVVDQVMRSHLIGGREALPFQSVRCAVIYKDASRRYQPPRLRAFLESLMRADSPPCKGGDYSEH